jgi:hypothetical protein
MPIQAQFDGMIIDLHLVQGEKVTKNRSMRMKPIWFNGILSYAQRRRIPFADSMTEANLLIDGGWTAGFTHEGVKAGLNLKRQLERKVD